MLLRHFMRLRHFIAAPAAASLIAFTQIASAADLPGSIFSENTDLLGFIYRRLDYLCYLDLDVLPIRIIFPSTYYLW